LSRKSNIAERFEFTPHIEDVSRFNHDFLICWCRVASLTEMPTPFIINHMIRTWKITDAGTREVHFADATSLDAVTRALPDGYYSTFRTFDGGTRVIGLASHFGRLPGADASSLRRHLNQLLEPYRPGEARVRLIMPKDGRVYIAIEPLKLLPREVHESGVRVETTTIQRQDPRTKSTIFIGQSEEERKKIAKTGIFEALLVKNGRILEGMTSNFFHIRDGILFTAQRDILLGVTRRYLIRAARGRGVEVRYIPLKMDQLPAVEEAFITSSSRGVVPVVQIDDVMVGQGRVGELTKELAAAYEAYVRRKAERI
jgi:branched-chain amino acid aminotransferase